MCVGRGALEKNERGKGLNQALFRFLLYIIIYVVAQAVTSETLTRLLPSIGYQFPPDYIAYVNILLALAFGYLTVGAVANAAYWSMRVRVPHSTASAVRSMIRLVGLGALMVAIAGGVAGGAAGVALGGFLGLVVGQATQSTLGQAIAGLFLLISRPFKIGDKVTLNGEDGVVDELTTLFTTIVKDDGKKVLLPNNSVVGNKIVIHPQKGS